MASRRPATANATAVIASPRISRSAITSALAFRDLVDQGRQDRVQVPDDAEVGDLEHGRLRVLVDHDDRPGALHAGAVLDRAGDATGDVHLRCDGLAGLPDLQLVR